MTHDELTIGLVAQTPAAHPLGNSNDAAADLRAACFRAVLDEFNPTGFTETMLAREIGRRGAQMIRDEQLIDSAEAQGDQALVHIISPALGAGAAAPLSISQMCAPDRLKTLLRAALQNSNAFFLRLRQFRKLQRDGIGAHADIRERDVRFGAEDQCVAYLARRFRLGHKPCRRCGRTSTGSWIAARKCWECAGCHTQTCIRHGTVMARSHVPLANWFHAVRVFLFEPTIGTSKLAETIGIRRLPTARSMLTKIRAGVMAENATQLLAGLDVIYFPGA